MQLIKRDTAKYRIYIREVATGKSKSFSIANHNIIKMDELKEKLEKFVETIK